MNNKVTFISLLKPLKRQLYIETTVKELHVFFLLNSLLFFFWMIVSRVFIILFVMRYILLGGGILIFIFLFRLWKSKPTDKDAALLMNNYVADDRVLSAYSFLEGEGTVEQLLVRDANQHMEQQLPTVLKRKKHWVYPKIILIAAAFLSVGVLSYLFPNSTMEAGIDKGKELQLINKVTKDLEDKINELEDENEKQVLQEHLDSIKKVDNADEFMEQLAKAYKELELDKTKENLKQQDLEKWQKALEEVGMERLADAIKSGNKETISSEINNIIENLANLTVKEKDVLSELTDAEAINEEVLKDWEKKLEESLLAGERKESIQSVQNLLETQAELLENYLKSNQLQTPDIALNPSDSNQSGNTSNPNGSSGSGQEQPNSNQGSTDSSQGQNGTNQGNGTGRNTEGGENQSGQNGLSHSGSGVGAGQSGTGSNSNGQGTNGAGAGIGQGSREFLTIPETLDGEVYLEEDFGELGEGKPGSQYETDAPVIKGNLRPYEEVFREYEAAYRESLERMNLPQDLENIIKSYFTNVKP